MFLWRNKKTINTFSAVKSTLTGWLVGLDNGAVNTVNVMFLDRLSPLCG